jgi:hypothetical protein
LEAHSNLITQTDKRLSIVAVKANTPSSLLPANQMNVRKRNGTLETINLNKIVKAIIRAAAGIADVDPVRVATKTIRGIHDGVSTQELDQLSISDRRIPHSREPQLLQAGRRDACRRYPQRGGRAGH